jgi:hypothetical protein
MAGGGCKYGINEWCAPSRALWNDHLEVPIGIAKVEPGTEVVDVVSEEEEFEGAVCKREGLGRFHQASHNNAGI